MNEAERKIGLSMKALAAEEERSRFDDYQRKAAAASSNVEDFVTARSRAGGNEG